MKRPKTRKRELIDSETRAIGIGPLDLDVDQARMLGWSEKSIKDCYAILEKESKRRSRAAERRFPERYEVLPGGTHAVKQSVIDEMMRPLDERCAAYFIVRREAARVPGAHVITVEPGAEVMTAREKGEALLPPIQTVKRPRSRRSKT